MSYQKQLFHIALLVLVMPSLMAETHEVIVLDNSFSPRNITIKAGDTVRWINEGPGSHNIYSMGNFRCANGCEAEGGDGSPAANGWVAEVTFRVPGTIAYECQPHVQFGMVGSVIVQPPSTDAPTINALTDNTFSNNDLTVNAGERVFFSNQGGVHNFRTNDDSLICADGCEGDGQSVSTDPTGFPWEFYALFNEPGDIPYYCANPAHNNQTGILRVISDVLFMNGFESQ